MRGYKTTVCVICGKIHDIAANCPDYQAICNLCRKLIEQEKLKKPDVKT